MQPPQTYHQAPATGRVDGNNVNGVVNGTNRPGDIGRAGGAGRIDVTGDDSRMDRTGATDGLSGTVRTEGIERAERDSETVSIACCCAIDLPACPPRSDSEGGTGNDFSSSK